MDKKTIIAFVLLTLLMAIFVNNQKKFAVNNKAKTEKFDPSLYNSDVKANPLNPTLIASTNGVKVVSTATKEIKKVSTDLYDIEFSTYGATITSLQLKNFKDRNGKKLEMVLGDSYKIGADGEKLGAFLLYFDANNQTNPFYGPFTFTDVGNDTYEFRAKSVSRVDGKDVPFDLVKRYTFVKDEYLFRLEVELSEPNGDYLPLNFSGFSYTIEGFPQIGPEFNKLDGQQNYRRAYYYSKDKRNDVKIKNGMTVQNDSLSWLGLTEKYFAFLAIPDGNSYRSLFTDKTIMIGDKEFDGTQLSFVRSQIKNSKNIDKFYFYLGPKQEAFLNKYNKAEHNSFALSNLDLNKSMDEAKILYPVEYVLRMLLQWSFSLVNNWGWAILLVTLIVKLALLPLAIKGLASSAKMADLSPKLKNLQEQYKNDPTALQQAQMRLYQSEGINPMAGCLPLVLQLPILLAMYNLFNKYFDFREAPWVGWITDLSAPEAIYTLPFTIPLLGWSAVRLLPVIYLFSQLLMNKVMKTDQTAQNEQMKQMMTIFPIVFFFILYDMPSGLLLYWIASNLFSVVQQLGINHLKATGKLDKMYASNKKMPKTKK